MNTDVEELLREGMERFTAGVRTPAGLADAARRLHRRRLAVRAAVACGTAAVTAAAAATVTVAATGTAARTGPSGAQAQTAVYVVQRVEKALASQHRVFRGRTSSDTWGPTVTWSYGPRNRFEEFTGNGCRHALPSGECTHHGGSEQYLAQGTALIGGKLTGVYVTYYNQEWSRVPGSAWTPPNSACSSRGAIETSGLGDTAADWPTFIHATLDCGAATVTPHVRIGGMDTTKITGKPVTVRLPTGEAKSLREKYLRARWTLYVNPRTYLPVRMAGSNETFGGHWGRQDVKTVTDVQWLRPTAANIAKTLVTIPPGFRHVKSPASQ